MTTDCNFRCKYCYEDYKNHYHLTEKKLIESINFIMNYGDRGKITLEFLGGEPLLKKELIYQAVEYINANFSDRKVKYYITTNCSLLDNEFIEFMRKNEFTVRLSFDGNKETHNLNRIDKSGFSCYENILKNVLNVKKSGLHYSVRMTITQNTIPYMFENIRFIHSQGLNNICMIMDVYLDLTDNLYKIFEEQVEMIVEYYIKSFDEGNKIILDQIDGKLLNFLCDFGNCFAMCNAGIDNFKIMPDGNIFPCSFLTNDQQFSIGNIYEGVRGEKARELSLSYFDKYNRKCVGCHIRDFCHGMKCGYMNFIRTGKINVPTETECLCEKVFYRAMVKIIEHYLELPRNGIEQWLGKYILYIKKSGLILSEYGIKVENRLQDE